MPFVVKENVDPGLFRFVTNRNLLWQYDFLIDTARIALNHMPVEAPRLTFGLMLALNHFAVVNLSASPGQLRRDFVHIQGSPHEPPHPDNVVGHVASLIAEVRSAWDRGDDGISIAANVLWRLTWIHPFEEGNGRTARAVAYYVLCVRLGQILGGTTTLPQLIRDDPKPYYEALRHADETLSSGDLDLSPMCNLLIGLLTRQLQT